MLSIEELKKNLAINAFGQTKEGGPTILCVHQL